MTLAAPALVIADISIFNLAGRRVLHLVKASTNTGSVNQFLLTTGLSAGTYMIRVHIKASGHDQTLATSFIISR